ncbi:MAG: hemerythrin domain-containing protein, partial [Sciscionella sp.]
MSADGTISTSTLTTLSTATHAESARPSSPNEVVIDAIRAHHAQLAEQLHAHTDAVGTAARIGECGRERDALHDWYRTELMPHVAAEEQALYSPASELEATRLLIRGMLAEHRFLESLIADLALASDPFQVVTTAITAQAVFTVHLSKENDLLLPALDQAGLDLPAILDGMHEILGHPHHDAEDGAEHDSCGCGCDHDTGQSQPVPLQVSAR